MSLDLDISGIGLRLQGVRSDDAARLDAILAGFVARGIAAPHCVVAVEEWGRAMVPDRAMSPAFEAVSEGSGMRYTWDEGELVVDGDGGRARMRIAEGDGGRRAWAFVNILNALLAFLLMTRKGGALHAAGIVLDGRAFLLVGPAGSGKTTWARAASERGVPVLSDDVVLLDGASGRLEALGAPIRHREFPGPGRGRWPVAAILLARHGVPSRLDPVPRLVVEPRLAANLLFLAQAWRSSARVAAALEAIVAGAPARTLTFAPDPSFLEVLRSFEA